MKIELLENEELHSLDINNLKIIQDKNGFKFGMDAVLLSDFAKEIHPNSKILDLCSGNGAISLLLSAKTVNTEITAVEIQEYSSNLAKKSIKLNNLEDRIHILCEDLNNLEKIYKTNSFDAIVCNPPYKKAFSGLTNNRDSKTIARHEIYCTLEDVIHTSSFLLKQNGSFYMVHRPERLVDIIYLLRKYNLEPKILRFIQAKRNKPANLLLIKAVKNGKSFLNIMENLIVYNDNNEYTKEFLEIYNLKN